MALMKDLYAGFLNKSTDDLDNLWQNSLITFDTNVLLNLYSYSEDTRDMILELIEKLKDRCFLTHRVGFEFHRKRKQVILDLIDKHVESLKLLNTYKNDLIGSTSVPHLSEDLLSNFSDITQRIESEINTNKEKYRLFLSGDDKILNSVHHNLGDSIGSPYDNDRLNEIYKMGAKRYDSSIPPGFTDKAKPDNEKYGDLIIWFQIIDKAKIDNQSVIFVTDEKKPDWWWQSASKSTTFGPQPQLIEEFYLLTNKLFHIYSTDTFLSHANKYLESKVSPDTISEVTQNQLKIDSFIPFGESSIDIRSNVVEVVIKSQIGSPIRVKEILKITEALGLSVYNLLSSSDSLILSLYTNEIDKINRLPAFISNLGYDISIGWESIRQSIMTKTVNYFLDNSYVEHITLFLLSSTEISKHIKLITNLIRDLPFLSNRLVRFEGPSANRLTIKIENTVDLKFEEIDNFLKLLFSTNIPIIDIQLDRH
ncbi:PIN domain-containing protein [Spirosoma oryzicola]|uniref:PIN domain-containing protein n=1 Tax=Spirosoma oryzicola TaxID=2898794 RepID=UPI001E65CA9C|nr:PIN domain-containing protein [Spirosoma oryzicola]UHG93302.1 PIN domain-containing protein [Spirosoma oryzicola]